MTTEVVDIHPHVISTDTLRYPRAPIGGHQSAWSRDRPVSVEQMSVEQDRAGVRKAALVQMHGEEGGTTGVDDDFAARGVAGIGAWIMGRNMFGPKGRCNELVS